MRTQVINKNLRAFLSEKLLKLRKVKVNVLKGLFEHDLCGNLT